jgi:hypothetical protein
VRGEYTASFVALFPADHPQLVVIVKIDDPRGSYYGGLTAAPVTRTMLQQALASQRVAIDRARLAPRDTSMADQPEAPAAPVGRPMIVVTLPYNAVDSAQPALPVPSVAGRSVREAALALHRRGLRVSLQGLGRVVRTIPAAGETVRPGTSVTVWAEE